MRIQPVFILGEEPEMRRQDGTSEIIKDESLQNQKIDEILDELKSEVKDVADVLPEIVVRKETDMKGMSKADLIIVYRMTGALWEALPKVAGLNVPTIFVVGKSVVWHAMEALEYLQNASHVIVSSSYEDVKEKIKACKIKKELVNSKILAFVPDVQSYSEFLNARYLPLKINDVLRFAFELIGKEELVQKYEAVEGSEIAKRWIGEAEKIVEPVFEDVVNVAKIYLALKDFVKEKRAKALAISCSPRMSPIRAPCIALSKLRDEGIPAACEVDLYSAATMMMLQAVSGRPAFMGNIVNLDTASNIVGISHCAMPFKMNGAEKQSYSLRNYHGERFLGSLTAYTELRKGQGVTLARIGRGLNEMLIVRGEIVSQKDGYDCRNTLFVKVNDLQAFVRNALGNHHCLIYGDYGKELRNLCQVMGIYAREL